MCYIHSFTYCITADVDYIQSRKVRKSDCFKITFPGVEMELRRQLIYIEG